MRANIGHKCSRSAVPSVYGPIRVTCSCDFFMAAAYPINTRAWFRTNFIRQHTSLKEARNLKVDMNKASINRAIFLLLRRWYVGPRGRAKFGAQSQIQFNYPLNSKGCMTNFFCCQYGWSEEKNIKHHRSYTIVADTCVFFQGGGVMPSFITTPSGMATEQKNRTLNLGTSFPILGMKLKWGW